MLRNSWKGGQRTTDPCWLEEGHGGAEVQRDELGPPSGVHSQRGEKPWPHPYPESLDLSFSGLYFRFSIYRGKADIL